MKLELSFLNTLFRPTGGTDTVKTAGSAATQGAAKTDAGETAGGLLSAGTAADASKTATSTAVGNGETSEIVQQLKDQGYVVTPDQEDRIAEFVKEVGGTPEQKMQAVKSALDKGLPLSVRVLGTLQAALSGAPLGELVAELSDALALTRLDMARSETTQELKSLLMQLSGQGADDGALTAEGSLVNEAVRSALSGSASSLLQASLAQLEGEDASVGERIVKQWIGALMQEMDQITVLLSRIEPEDAQQSEVPRERPVAGAAGRVAVVQSQTDASVNRAAHAVVEDLPQEQDETVGITPVISDGSETETEEADDAVQALSTASQDDTQMPAVLQQALMVVREITPRMAELKTQYVQERNKVLDDIRKVSSQLDAAPKDTKTQQETLAKAIERLDKVILKSDIPLYTSMQTEKGLLTASSSLQDARRLLNDGQTAAAKTVLDRVEKDLKALVFQPSKQKILHMAGAALSEKSDWGSKSVQERVRQQLDRILEPAQTPRAVLDAFRALGLEHEAEVVTHLGNPNRKSTESWEPKDTLRQVLMQLAKDTEESLTTVTAAEKSLNNLTGQQLMNRPESRPQGQTLFFSLPMKLADRVEDLKIYVQSRKDRNKIDWENCTFYFAVNTQNYGEVGIGLTAVRKTVSVQVKCNSKELQEALEPIAKDFQQVMAETGYKIAGISYSRLTDATDEAADNSVSDFILPDEEGKGLNVRI